MIIFHNPHTKIGFGQTFADFVYRTNISKKSQKYKYLLDYLAKNKIKFGVFLDFIDSSLPLFMRGRFFIYMELIIWLLLKRINPLSVQIISDVSKITKNDIFFSFSWNTLDSDYHGVDFLSQADFLKVFHLTHIHQNTSLIAKNFERLRVDFGVAENNLQNTEYFNHFFPGYKKNIYTLPFAFSDKYKRNKLFLDRENLCLSVGAIINIFDYNIFEDFHSFFHIDTLQPIRKSLLDASNGDLEGKIYNSGQVFKVENEAQFGILVKLTKKIKRIIFGSKNSYFNFDIVEKFNHYRMFINGEEAVGLPGIGFIEGMACGCAYVGLIDSMYTDIGLIPGYHYIGHNGTMEDILSKIGYYQDHPKELEVIAYNGYDFVQKNFKGEIVAKKFYNDLDSLAHSFLTNKSLRENLNFNCSFIKNAK